MITDGPFLPMTAGPQRAGRTKRNALELALQGVDFLVAERTGLEPATPGVTGRYSNQLNYRSTRLAGFCITAQVPAKTWRPLGDSNPCNHRERVVS